MSDLRLLPHDPVGFFVLEQGYDRRDLKRAYGVAIRQYKPETHPDEFRRVRDAYEQLEKQLRYGSRQQELSIAADTWTNSVPVKTTPAEPSEIKRERTLSELALIDPSAAAARLRTQVRRTPPDYYLAAVLADATEGKPTAKYLGRLIEGLVAFPSDPGLTMLATEYLRGGASDASDERTVEFVAKELRSPVFYMLTEPVWLRLVKKIPFGRFALLLQRCEQSIHQTDPVMRATFCLRLLQSAVWVAPPQWIDAMLSDLESHSIELDIARQNDLEFVAEIRQLLKLRASSPLRDPIREKLLKALRLACQAETGASLSKIVDLLAEIARDASGVQRAFPLGNEEEDRIWVSVVYKLVQQVEAFEMESNTVPMERIAVQTMHLIRDLEPTAVEVTSAAGRTESHYKTYPLVLWLLCGTTLGCLLLVMTSFSLTGDAVGLFFGIGIISLFAGLLWSFYGYLYPKFLQPRQENAMRRGMLASYGEKWRSRLFRYVKSSPETIDVHASRIAAICANINRSDLTNIIHHFMRLDGGLCLFAALQTVIR